MRPVVVRVMALLVIAGSLLAAVLFCSTLLFKRSLTSSREIALENTHPGTTNWVIPEIKAAITEIQAYAGATSVLPGQKLTFYVSTLKEGTPYHVDIYRLGWYGGSGGRHMTSQPKQIGHAQGYYNSKIHRLVDCSSCHVDPNIGLIEANWQPSYMLSVPLDWTTGVYLAKFTDIRGFQTYAPFDVRGNSHSLYVVVTPDTTNEAYNVWGGYSLYQAYSNTVIGSSGKGVKVSFDRPYAAYFGSSYLLPIEADAIYWLERQGYDLSYISSVDLHEDPAQLLQHRAYLSLGHDEYWTKEMRDGVERARDSGVGLAFLGANAAYWQMRFESDSADIADRTIVCYKVETGHRDLARDPLYKKDNSLVTTTWRDPLLGRPENMLIGIMFSNGTHLGRYFPWRLNPLTRSPLLNGTGLQPGQSYGCGLVGFEWDRVFANGATPTSLQVIGVSRALDDNNHPDTSNTTYYIAPSGAMVFATGSIYWTAALDSYRFQTTNSCLHRNPVVLGIQSLMAHVMDALVH